MSHINESETTTLKLKAALIALLEEKDIRNITTKEITHRSQVSRGALYTHYDDKYALFEEIVEDKQKGLSKAIYESLKNKDSINFKELDIKVHPTLSYIAENKAFFRTMIDPNKMPYVNFHQFLLHVYKEDVVLAPIHTNLSAVEQDIYAHYRALYTYAIILYWMKKGMKSSPEQITQQFWDLIRQKRFYWIFGNPVDQSTVEDPHVDRRVLRTRKAIQEAMIELILEKKDYASVTISEITRRSNIRRATFYDHYSSKEAVLQDIIQKSCSDLIHIFTVETQLEEVTTEQSEAILERLFTYLAKHRSDVHFISANYGIPDPVPQMLDCLSDFYLKQNINITAGKEMYAYYVSGMIIGLILYRLQDGIQHSSKFLAHEFIRYLELKKYKIIML